MCARTHTQSVPMGLQAVGGQSEWTLLDSIAQCNCPTMTANLLLLFISFYSHILKLGCHMYTSLVKSHLLDEGNSVTVFILIFVPLFLSLS